jgi:hypothetical protein
MALVFSVGGSRNFRNERRIHGTNLMIISKLIEKTVEK